LLDVQELEVHFGAVQALAGFSMAVSRDEIVALIGPNGAGKSTAVKTIAGVNRPSSGRVVYNDEDISGLPAHTVVGKGISLVPQGRRLFPSLTVRENVEMGAFSQQDKQAVAADLEHWVNFFPEVRKTLSMRAANLSGGQQQIVALVRGLMSRPSILMLDEPSIGVAPPIVRRIGEEIRRLNREGGVGIVIVEQNVGLALDVADRVIVLAQGRDVHAGPPSELRDPDVLAAHFFGSGAGGSREPEPA
jgi:branched-chain amino acid transport system ATP-binding protein